MTPVGDPAQACALLVGVEQCGVFPDDPLLGPVRDALQWFDWLVARGVPPRRIVLCLSAKPASQPLVDEWLQRMQALPATERPRQLAPTEAALQDLIVTELPDLAAGVQQATLLLVWSGHGVIDQREGTRTRRLFHADATALNARNLEPVSLMKALRTRPYAGFGQQLLVVDACANYVVGTARDRRMLRSTDFGDAVGAPGVQQRVLLATAPGQVAATDAGTSARESVALFSSRLLAALGEPPAGQWPDFQAAFRSVQQAFAAAAATAGVMQTPVDWCYGLPDDTLPDSAVQLLPDARATQLLGIVQALPDELVAPAFLAALPPARPTPAHQAAVQEGAAAMAWLLGEMPQAPGLPDALLRWALQLRCRLPVAADHPELLLWIKRQRQEAAAQAYLQQAEAERQAGAAGRTLCFVLVAEEPGASAGTAVLHGWLFAGEPAQVRALGDGGAPITVQADGANRAACLKQLLDEAAAAAQALGIELPDFIIEVALPLERVDDDVEARPFGPHGRERAIGSRYPVVRRLADRLAALGHRRKSLEILQWQKAALQLGQRFSAHGLRIVWMEPQGIRDGLLASRLDAAPQGSCVGLSLAVPGRTLDEAIKYTLFDDGLPFACWSDAAWNDADTACLEADLGACSGPQALLKLFALRQADAARRTHPGSRLRLLWDDPARNPYAPQLRAAEP